MPGSRSHEAPPQALALHDARSFFERALAHGVNHGILGAEKLAALHAEAPKGMVQIARYFGSEFLRPELERARERIVNFVSLHLQDASGGDLAQAAQLLATHSLLSRSKAGTDMLRALIALPESTHFGMQGQDEAQVSLLALWSLRSYAQYREELARRSRIGEVVQAALWIASHYQLDDEALEEGGADAEGVLRTALALHALAPRSTEWPSAATFQKLLAARRKAGKAVAGADALAVPKGLPTALHAVVDAQKPVVLADLQKLLDPARPLAPQLRPMTALRHRYFLLEDPLGEVDEYLRAAASLAGDEAPPAAASKTWQRATLGEQDEAALLTLFLCLATGTPKKTLLPEKAAKMLVRKLRSKGWQPELADAFIREHAPEVHRADYLALWQGFVSEARGTLQDDHDYGLGDALALLRRECHVSD